MKKLFIVLLALMTILSSILFTQISKWRVKTLEAINTFIVKGKDRTTFFDNLNNSNQLTTTGIEDSTITKPKLSPGVYQYIDASGGGSITNNPDDHTIRVNQSNALYVDTTGNWMLTDIDKKVNGNTSATDTVGRRGLWLMVKNSFAVDTAQLKTLDRGSYAYLERLSSASSNGGGWFAVMDSTYPEGIIAFNHPTSGKQWVRVDFLTNLLFNVTWAGANGFDGNDDTDAFVKCLKHIEIIANNSTQVPTLYVPVGVYYVGNVVLPINVLVKGEEVRSTTLVYKGAGGAGTFIFKYSAASGSTPYYGFVNIAMIGDENSGVLPENIIFWDAGVDWGFKLDNVLLSGSFGDGIVFNKGYVNLYVNRIRFGWFGGFCVKFVAPSGMENRPVSIEDFTWDNNANSTAVNLLKSYGASDGSFVGKGLISVIDSGGIGGVYLELTDGRIELNKPLGSPFSIIHVPEIGNDAVQPTLFIRNVTAFGQSSNVPFFILASRPSRLRANLVNVVLDKVIAISYESQDVSELVYSQPHGVFQNLNTPFGYGWNQRNTLTGNRLEFADNYPNGYEHVKKGDVFIDIKPDTNGTLGYVLVSPDSGWVVSNGAVTWSNASMNSGEDSLRVSIDKNLFPGVRVIVPGAGPSGADLEATVIEVIREKNIYRLSKKASTTVSGVTVRQPAPVWKSFGLVNVTKVVSMDTSLTPTTTEGIRQTLNDLIENLKKAGIMLK
ncbi:MAG: hypothetical protein GXO75_08450 [Calditrichaeota bacterium]|nr:hypothetical protein [Calditrichota bacterium]